MASANPTPSDLKESRAAQTLREIFESGRPLTYIRSAEEQRVGRVLREVGRGLLASTLTPMPKHVPTPVWTWSRTEGLHRDGEAAEAFAQAPRGALDFIVAHADAGIFHLKD